MLFIAEVGLCMRSTVLAQQATFARTTHVWPCAVYAGTHLSGFMALHPGNCRISSSICCMRLQEHSSAHQHCCCTLQLLQDMPSQALTRTLRQEAHRERT
jgi:hypothetical protein